MYLPMPTTIVRVLYKTRKNPVLLKLSPTKTWSLPDIKSLVITKVWKPVLIVWFNSYVLFRHKLMSDIIGISSSSLQSCHCSIPAIKQFAGNTWACKLSQDGPPWPWRELGPEFYSKERFIKDQKILDHWFRFENQIQTHSLNKTSWIKSKVDNSSADDKPPWKKTRM